MLFAETRLRLSGLFEQRRTAWIERRHPPSGQATLRSNRVYILPTRACVGLVLLLLILALLAINYENNLVYGLTFLLCGLLVVSMHHTHANLCGLVLARSPQLTCFSGEPTRFDLELRGEQRAHRHLCLRYTGGDERAVNVEREERIQLELTGAVAERGWFSPGYLHVESTFPLGLFRTWSWVDLDQQVLVYPKPIKGGELDAAMGEGESAREKSGGQDEFAGFADYTPGAQLKHLAWKNYARGQDLKIKQFNDTVSDGTWLSWTLWPELGVEARLSRLCYWALELDRRAVPYGLKMPGIQIDPEVGDEHLRRVLFQLAVFGKSES